MVATVTLIVVARPTVAATLAPPVILATDSSIPSPIFLFLLGPTETFLAQQHPFPLILPLLGITGPDSLGPSLLLPFPLHLGLLLLNAMHLLLVFLVHNRHKVITPGLVLL